MQEATLGILIGRFQPLHRGHCFLIESALKKCEHLLIIVGSSYCARTIKNPWTFDERKALINNHFPDGYLSIHAVNDFFYAETEWFNAVKHLTLQTLSHFPHLKSVKLFGHSKDASSYYLAMFEDWQYEELPNFKGIDATRIRQDYFRDNLISTNLPPISQDFLKNFQHTAEFERLKEEAAFVKRYKASWQNSPYPPTFVTTDAVVFCNDHLLLIKRKYCPGKGLYALPGGFVEEHEWIKQGLIRELLEETGINITQTELLQALISVQIFDYPERSLIGRVITHAGYYELPFTCLPELSAADDALQAEWIPLAEIPDLREQYHDDHYQIITHFLRSRL